MLARARKGRNRRNIVRLPDAMHRAWHALFGLLTPEEAKRFIDEVMVAGKDWDECSLDEVRRRIIRN